MKIIYVPVVIPVNVRTLVALVLSLVGAILVIVGTSTRSWLLMELRTQRPSVTSHISKIVAYQALQAVDVYICSQSVHFKGDFCDPRHVVYLQCDDATDSWCVGRAGYLTAFFCGIAAGILGFLSIAVGLVRELKHGIVAGVAAVLTIIGTIAYSTAYSSSVGTGLLQSLLAEAQTEHGSVQYHLGFSFYCYMLGACLLLVSACVSLSLRVYLAHGEDNRAHNPPKIQLVHMDTNNATQIATVAPQPGFVQLSDGRLDHVPESDDDDDVDKEHHHRDVQSAEVPVANLSRTEAALSPIRRADTAPPSVQNSFTDTQPPVQLPPNSLTARSEERDMIDVEM